MKKLLINLLIKYKRNISPIIKPDCRFTPTCSEYAILALEKYSLIKAASLIMFRLVRCNPLTKKNSKDFAWQDEVDYK